jgi:hypothetical protein
MIPIRSKRKLTSSAVYANSLEDAGTTAHGIGSSTRIAQAFWFVIRGEHGAHSRCHTGGNCGDHDESHVDEKQVA